MARNPPNPKGASDTTTIQQTLLLEAERTGREKECTRQAKTLTRPPDTFFPLPRRQTASKNSMVTDEQRSRFVCATEKTGKRFGKITTYEAERYLEKHGPTDYPKLCLELKRIGCRWPGHRVNMAIKRGRLKQNDDGTVHLGIVGDGRD